MDVVTSASDDLINPNRQYITTSRPPKESHSPRRAPISAPSSHQLPDLTSQHSSSLRHYYQYPTSTRRSRPNEQYPLYPRPMSVSSVPLPPATSKEKTINYEFSVQLRLPVPSPDVTGFYRKISNLIGTVVIEGYLSTGDVTTVQKFPAFDNVGPPRSRAWKSPSRSASRTTSLDFSTIPTLKP